MTFYIDTGYLLALEVANDQNHLAAKAHWQHVRLTKPHLVTTSYVLEEMVTFLNSRGYHAKAVQAGNRLLHSAAVELIHVDRALFRAGWTYFE